MGGSVAPFYICLQISRRRTAAISDGGGPPALQSCQTAAPRKAWNYGLSGIIETPFILGLILNHTVAGQRSDKHFPATKCCPVSLPELFERELSWI